mmetsp:Transcript_119310/g.266489  ORF Transcript_119310/g.266489 Transcript_119310/m.266489 type:complete len:329 (+) Transcript_119310:507-1493(+)
MRNPEAERGSLKVKVSPLGPRTGLHLGASAPTSDTPSLDTPSLDMPSPLRKLKRTVCWWSLSPLVAEEPLLLLDVSSSTSRNISDCRPSRDGNDALDLPLPAGPTGIVAAGQDGRARCKPEEEAGVEAEEGEAESAPAEDNKDEGRRCVTTSAVAVVARTSAAGTAPSSPRSRAISRTGQRVCNWSSNRQAAPLIPLISTMRSPTLARLSGCATFHSSSNSFGEMAWMMRDISSQGRARNPSVLPLRRANWIEKRSPAPTACSACSERSCISHEAALDLDTLARRLCDNTLALWLDRGICEEKELRTEGPSTKPGTEEEPAKSAPNCS